MGPQIIVRGLFRQRHSPSLHLGFYALYALSLCRRMFSGLNRIIGLGRSTYFVTGCSAQATLSISGSWGSSSFFSPSFSCSRPSRLIETHAQLRFAGGLGRVVIDPEVTWFWVTSGWRVIREESAFHDRDCGVGALSIKRSLSEPSQFAVVSRPGWPYSSTSFPFAKR